MAARGPKQLAEKGAVTAVMAAVLGLGCALHLASIRWGVQLCLTLPPVARLPALLAYRLSSQAGVLLGVFSPLPNWARTWQRGLGLELASGVTAGFLCLATLFLLPAFIDLRHLRARLRRRLSGASCRTDVAGALLDEALRAIGAEIGEVLLRRNGEERPVRFAARGLGNTSFTDVPAPDDQRRTVGEWVLQEGRAYLCEPRPDASGSAARAGAVLPLQSAGTVLGLLCVGSPSGRSLGRRDMARLRAIAEEAAVVLAESPASPPEAPPPEQRGEGLAVLEEVPRGITASLDLEATLRAILVSARRLIPFDLGQVTLWDSVQGCLVSRRSLNAGGYHVEAGSRHQLDEGCPGWLARNRQPLLISDTSGWQDVRPKLNQPDASVRSYLGIPLERRGELLGTLELISHEPNAFSEHGLEILQSIGLHAATAIENARLLEALQQRLDTLSIFNELSRSVTAKLDLDEVLETVVDATARLVKCQGSIVFLQDPVTDRYTPRAAHGHDLVALEACTFAPGEGLVGTVAKSGVPLSIVDVGAETGGEANYIRQGAAVLAPLSIGGQVVGVLTADRSDKEAFTPTDVATLAALADQVAVAVQNARLFDETVRRTEELSKLLDAAGVISSSLDLDWVLQTLGDLLLSVTGADVCVISEWDREEGDVRVVWEVGEDTDRSLVGAVYPSSKRPRVAEVLLIQEPLLLRVDDPQIGEEAWSHLRERGIRSVLLVSMVARGRTVGLVELEQRQGRRDFTGGEIRLAQALANQAATAVQNARLYREIRRFSEELEQRVEERTHELARALKDLTAERDRMAALYRIAAEVSVSLDLERVLNRTLALVVQAVGAERGSILLENPETGQLMCRATFGSPERIPPGGVETRVRRGEGLAGWVMSHGEAALVGDVQADPRWVVDPERDAVHRACLALPLGTAGEVHGALLLFSTALNAFTEDHLRLGEAAAAQIANAVGNAALYNLVQEQAERLGAMLKQQEVEAAKSRAVLEGVADGVIVADADGQVILFNAAAERILEIPRERALGYSTREMLGLYGVEGRAWLTAMREWTKNPADRTPEAFVAQRLEMGERVVGVHVSPVIMGSEYLGTVSVFRDITAEVEASRAKSEFVSIVSHEMRTPMTSIKGYAELLLAGMVGELDEQQSHFLTVIRSNADRLTALVNDLLDISRIETGRMDLDRRAVHIHEVVEQVLGTLQGRAQSRGLTVETRVSPDLPAVWGDSSRVTQILTNLMGNAIQYTPPGGEVTVSARSTDDMLEVSVADTGIGISRENQARIFERFFRADDPLVQETSGTGLGLAITASLVDMHHGKIWVESEPGEGSTFTFTLPLASVIEVPAPVPVPQGFPMLVVEDDADVANLIRIHLEGQGYDVVTVGRGDEAVRAAREIHPALITLDIRLPDADGFVVLERLKRDPETADIPVVIVSVVPDVERGLALGAVDYVGKPIEERSLLEAVRRVLHQRGLILVVDDDRDNLSLTREALRRHGFGVRTTGRGRRALRVAREVKPALILLDLKLRDIDGYEVLRRLKSDARTGDIPVIVMTGSLTREELKAQQAAALGAASFLTKPFAVEDLLEKITGLLRQAGQGGSDDLLSREGAA